MNIMPLKTFRLGHAQKYYIYDCWQDIIELSL